ncbi:MAG: efflux RND transporter periplasmic adaptor subunit [Rikenellaceae bacterium]
MQNNLSWWFIATALLIVVGCKTHPKATSDSPTLEIECQTATTQNICDQIWFTTTTQAIQTAVIEPRVSGFLTSATPKSGELVAAGELLYTIDTDQLTTLCLEAEATLASAEATLVEARNNYERAKPMADINAISRSTLDSYRANYASATADVASAKQALRNARLNLSYATITSPIAGLVANTSATVGDYVGVGTEYTTLTTINNIDTLQLPLAIPTATYLRHSSTAESYDNSRLLSDITLILADSSQYPIVGSYAYTEQNASSYNSSIVVVVNFANPQQQLKAGMFARVRSNIGRSTPRVVIPQQAVVQLQGTTSVWVVAADSTAHNRRVTMGRVHGSMWEVRSGLSTGEVVATSGQLKLHEGMKVTPKITTTNI